MAIDTHAHLFSEHFDTDREEVILNAKNNGIKKIVIVGFSKETNILAQNLCKKYDFIFPTAGYHPEVANDIKELDILKLKQFIKENKVYAIGECGLDYYWVNDNKEQQKWLFEEQIKLAINSNLPLIVHCRDAINDTLELLKKYANKVKFVMHCFSGSKEMALEFIKIGGMISLGGPVTFKNARISKEVAKIVPLDKLLIETDSPYLAPMPYRGKRNESSYVNYVLKEIAEIKEIDIKKLESILDINSENFFGI